MLTAQVLNAKTVVTPVLSNDMVRRLPDFDVVQLTKIGSPFVVAGMDELRTSRPDVVGFEATIKGSLGPLPSRDCMLSMIVPLLTVKAAGKSLAESVADLPLCFTVADRLQDIDRAKAPIFLSRLIKDEAARAAFAELRGVVKAARGFSF